MHLHRVLHSVQLFVSSQALSLLGAPGLPQAVGQADSLDPLEIQYRAELERGFKSRRSVLPVLLRLADVSSAAASDPCGADILANGLARPFGFGSRALVLSDELELALYFNKSVAICDGSLEEPGIGWSRFFQNPAGVVMCTNLETCSARRSDSNIHVASMLAKDLRRQHFDFQRKVKQLLYRGLFTYNSATQDVVEASLAAAGLKAGMRYAGVHVRRGDKRMLNKLGIDEYAAHVMDAMRSHGLDTVYVASDDPAAANDLRPLLEAEFPTLQVLQAYSPSSAARDYGNESDDTALLALLADLTALQRSEVFVGSHKSSFARTAFYMRDNTQQSISVDGNFLREEGIIEQY